MYLQLYRVRFYTTHTIGQLYIDGELFCFTLEDVVREEKIPNETAIPTGTYEVVLETSPKFGPETVTVKNVPGFTGIRIHAGNTADDTEGCIILGYKLAPNNTIQFGTTRPAVNDLKKILQRTKDKVYLEVTNIK
jgi:hypothetical protein